MPSNCPTHKLLTAYALGTLPLDCCEQIDRHLEQCPDCQAELETCGNAGDTFLSRLQQPDSAIEFLDEEQCAQVMARVAAIGHEPSFTTQRQLDEAGSSTTDLGEIGPYQLLAKLGAGGMGTVYKAFHPKLKRVVALKMLPTERMQDQQAIARFEREMEAVGRLDHPHIVRATDAGEQDDKHFLVMEYVEGIDLSDLVRRHGPLSVADSCELIRQAAVGLEHAFQASLVHRDIKPSNLMLTTDGSVKILDLGLALLPETGEAGRELTTTGQAMGTLDYMAPEQGGDSHEVDIRADIYALGATLYKLLTGEAVFAGEKYNTPVQKLTALAITPAPDIQSRRSDVPAELGAIVHRMISKDRDERFSTPSEVAKALASFAADAELYALMGHTEDSGDLSVKPAVTTSTTSLRKKSEAIQTDSQLAKARQGSRVSASRKGKRLLLFIALAVGMVGLLALPAIFYFQTSAGTLRVEINDPEIEVLVKGTSLTLRQGEKEETTLSPGNKTLVVKHGNLSFETKQFEIKQGEVTTVKVDLLPGAIQVVDAGGTELANKPIPPTVAPAVVPAEKPAVVLASGPYETTQSLTASALVALPRKLPGLRNWTVETRGHRGQILALKASPDGALLASAGDDGALRIWDRASEQLKQSLLAHDGPIADLAWSPNSQQLATVGQDGQTRIWSLEQAKVVKTFGLHERSVQAVAWSSDGKQLATAGEDGTVRRWDLDLGIPKSVVRDLPAFIKITWDSANDLLVGLEREGTVWQVGATGPAQQLKLELKIHAMARRATDGLFALGDEKGNVHIWQPGKPTVEYSLAVSKLRIRSLAFSNEKDFLAIADNDDIKVWSVAGKSKLIQMKPHERVISSMAWMPSGAGLFAANLSGDIHRWMLADGEARDFSQGHVFNIVQEIEWAENGRLALAGRRHNYHRLDFSDRSTVYPDGHEFVATYRENCVPSIWRIADFINRITLSPHGALLGIGNQIGQTNLSPIRDANTGEGVFLVRHNGINTPPRVWFSHDEKKLLTHGIPVDHRTRAVRIWDLETGELEATVDLGEVSVDVVWNTKTGLLALRRPGQPISVHRIDSFDPEKPLVVLDTIEFCEFSPDGKVLAAFRHPGVIALYDAMSGQVIKEIALEDYSQYGSATGGIAWFPDQRHVVVRSRSGYLSVCDLETATTVWRHPVDKFKHALFSPAAPSPQGRSLLAAQRGQIVMLDAKTGEQQQRTLCLDEGILFQVNAKGHWATATDHPIKVIYVAEQADGQQQTFAPTEFEQQYGWKNDPTQVHLLLSDALTNDESGS